MATRFRKLRTRKQKSKALKTRKHRGGNGILNRLGLTRKSPLSSAPSLAASKVNKPTNNVQMMNLASIGINPSDLQKTEKIMKHAKRIREHVARYENANENVKREALAILNRQGLQKEKEKLLLIAKYPGWKNLSDKQLLELYIFGKPRSTSV